eukprot:CAMPEP_0114242118 /NCGR_PEP_ID=MMETSP0058-20121206/9994_1 /TAXON_ID=36894 /ORGANISM="Pyramimonas parkeae, CCMP726" /LENGTH=352 /DNA_ID=CAMNT_0001354687 /DNA_START=260 /DNA_END=1318 /DNA_ORIENTATION=+
MVSLRGLHRDKLARAGAVSLLALVFVVLPLLIFSWLQQAELDGDYQALWKQEAAAAKLVGGASKVEAFDEKLSRQRYQEGTPAPAPGSEEPHRPRGAQLAPPGNKVIEDWLDSSPDAQNPLSEVDVVEADADEQGDEDEGNHEDEQEVEEEEEEEDYLGGHWETVTVDWRRDQERSDSNVSRSNSGNSRTNIFSIGANAGRVHADMVVPALPAVWPAVVVAPMPTFRYSHLDDQEVKPPALTKEQEERNQKRLESFKNSQYQLKLEASRAARKGEMDRQMQLKIVKAQGPKHYKMWLAERAQKQERSKPFLGLYPIESETLIESEDEGPDEIDIASRVDPSLVHTHDTNTST